MLQEPGGRGGAGQFRTPLHPRLPVQPERLKVFHTEQEPRAGLRAARDGHVTRRRAGPVEVYHIKAVGLPRQRLLNRRDERRAERGTAADCTHRLQPVGGDLAKLVAVLCIVAWRTFWTTMVARAAPEAPAKVALTPAEMTVLGRAVPDGPGQAPRCTLATCLAKVARLGGYLAHTRDPPPGNTVMWRGWARLADIMLGAELAERRCG